MDLTAHHPALPPVPVPLPAALTWTELLAREPDLGVCELQALILSRRPAPSPRDWDAIVATVYRLRRRPAERRVALDHLRGIVEGGR